jgi:1-aminocyclopropane-1-carboxylate deaminase/D-cysteine desulfhydrase-like pyridoxal-dependent ACC family enzyme
LADSCERIREQTGLSLDPIFGGKTWSVMERHLMEETPGDDDVLYWHCGFTPEWKLLGRTIEQGTCA